MSIRPPSYTAINDLKAMSIPGTPLLPSKHAGPTEIKKFLRRIMVEKLEVPERDAQIKAQYWEHRRGEDLRKASKKQFTNLFGSSLGPPLWDAVFEDTVAEWRSSLLGKLSLWTMNGMPVLAAILFFEAFMKSGNEPARSGPLPIEVLLWVSGPVRLVCLWQEIEHKVHTLAGFNMTRFSQAVARGVYGLTG